jgi:hypothetical protein
MGDFEVSVKFGRQGYAVAQADEDSKNIPLAAR